MFRCQGRGIIAAPILFANGPVCGFSQNQACAGFQQCIVIKDPSICLQEMLTALSAVSGGAAGGAAGTSPCGQTTAPCQGGAVAAPMPQPMPYPQPAPYPMPYPGDISMQPASCGGTYPCKDKPRKSKKGKKHRDSRDKKHHKSHHKKA